MKNRVFIDPNFKPDSTTISKSVRFPENLFPEIEKAAKIIGYEHAVKLISDLVFAFLKGDLCYASTDNENPENIGKIQALETENKALKGMNTQLKEEITLYQGEIEILKRHIPLDEKVHTPSVFTPKTALIELHTNAHTSAHTPNTVRVQPPNLGAHTDFSESAHTLEQGAHTLNNAAHTTSVTQEQDHDSNLKKIQELENEIDEILGEKDDVQNKLEKTENEAVRNKYALDKSIAYICSEIKKVYQIEITESSLHEIFDHFSNQYHEQNEISTDR